LETRDYRLFDIQHAVLPTRLPLAEFYRELVTTQRAIYSRHLDWRQLLDASGIAARLLLRGQTNFIRSLFALNKVYDPGLLLAWGTALVHMRQSVAAAAIFRRLLEQNAANASLHLLLGQASAQQKDYAGAINEISKALELDPRLTEAHYYAGLVYLEQKELESAAREFRAELAIRPNDARTMYHLGYTLLLQEQLPESVALLRQVVKAMPDYELAYFELGRALLQQEDPNGAIENLEKAKKLAPDHTAVYFQLSQAYRRAGRTQEAGRELASYQKLIEANRQKKRESLEADRP